MWIYNIWGQFEKLKAIHLNTNWYLTLLYPKKKKKTLQKKKLIHNIIFIYWDISNMNDLFKKIKKKKIRAKTQVMNETISS